MGHEVDAGVLRRLLGAAAARGILGGRFPALFKRLQGLGEGLELAPLALPLAGDDGMASAARGIGDAFSRSVFTDATLRKLTGAFYTPEALIDVILDLVWKESFPDGRMGARTTLLDPAMGCGFFLVRAAERLLARHDGARVRRWARRGLCGVDADARAVFMARALLWLTLSDANAEFVPDPARLRQGDSLLGPAFGQDGGDGLGWAAAFPDAATAGGFAAIVGNPPYEVLTNFSKHPEHERLARALRESGHYRDGTSGQVNLYRCFCERSLGLLRPSGLLAFVVPLSLARDARALPLRRRLLEREAAGEWLLFGEDARLFAGVTQSACIFRARRDGGRAERVTVRAKGGAVSLALADIDAWSGGALTIPYVNAAEAKLLEWLGKNVRGCIGDVCAMRVGEVDQTVYRECMADEDTGCVLARGSHLAPFHLDVAPVPGKQRFLRLERFTGRREGAAVERVAQLGIRNMLTRPRLAAAIAPAGVYLGNSLNYYVPGEGVSVSFLAGVLNSRLLDWLFRMGSGNNNINLHEVRALPFPVGADGGAVERAYAECVAVAERGDDVAAARAALDQAVEDCYGVPEELRNIL